MGLDWDGDLSRLSQFLVWLDTMSYWIVGCVGHWFKFEIFLG